MERRIIRFLRWNRRRNNNDEADEDSDGDSDDVGKCFNRYFLSLIATVAFVRSRHLLRCRPRFKCGCWCGYQTLTYKQLQTERSQGDKILIVDSINNFTEYFSFKRILNEVHNYFLGIKVEFAYSLAKGL